MNRLLSSDIRRNACIIPLFPFTCTANKNAVIIEARAITNRKYANRLSLLLSLFFLVFLFSSVFILWTHCTPNGIVHNTQTYIHWNQLTDKWLWFLNTNGACISFKGHFHAIFLLYATNWRQCASIYFQIYINDYKNMLSTSWKNHIRSIKAHITHGMWSKKKRIWKVSWTEEKKTLVKKRITKKNVKCRKINFHLCAGKISSIGYQRSQTYGYVCNGKKRDNY